LTSSLELGFYFVFGCSVLTGFQKPLKNLSTRAILNFTKDEHSFGDIGHACIWAGSRVTVHSECVALANEPKTQMP